MTFSVSEPLSVESSGDCLWYHTFDFPDGTIVRGRWDYRLNVDDYLGRLEYSGKTVLELGPASGFLTRAMEKRGADILCIDVNVEQGWDVVPRLDRDYQLYIEERRELLPRLWKSWWLTRQVFGGTAQISYSGAESIGELVGTRSFDVGLVGSILVHFQNPYVVLSQLARLCDTIVITELYTKRLDVAGRALLEFLPASKNNNLGSWWLLSERVVEQMMETLNFEKTTAYYANYRRWDMIDMDISRDTYTDHQLYTHVYCRRERDERMYGMLREA